MRDLVRKVSSMGPGPGVEHLRTFPFHCWSITSPPSGRPLLRRKPGNAQNDEKTLGWPTIYGQVYKTDGFENGTGNGIRE